MNKSEHIEKLAAALVKAMPTMKTALMDSTNPFFKSKYADLSSVKDAVRDSLMNNGLTVSQFPDQTATGEPALTTILIHESGQWISGTYPLMVTDKESTPQGYGSALTYARRYGLSAVLGVIADTDDDGNAATRPQKPAAANSAPQDPDITEGVKNWVDKQKGIITATLALPGLYVWLDDVASLDGQSGNIASPDSQSALGRLKRKAPEAYAEISQFYQARFEALSKK